MAIEQQTRQRSLRRKLLEQFMAVILDLRATKDEVLELYLNDVYLGNRGSFAIHGVAEAARLYFGKDVNNLSLGEAATIAGIIQSPGTLSPFNSPARTRERRNVVLRAMVDAGFVSADAAERATKEPLAPVARALDAEAPYFVDFVGQALAEQFPGGHADDRGRRRLHDARPAPAAPRAGRGHAAASPRSISCCRAGAADACRRRR